MKAILEFEAPGSCVDCPFGNAVVKTMGYGIACGLLEDKWTDREIGRALYCPLRIVEDGYEGDT